MSDEVPATELEKEHREDVSKYIEEIRGSVKRPPGKFEAIPDPMTPEELAAQTKAAAKGAAERLVRRRVSGQMGYLKNRSDGSASLAIITSGKLDTFLYTISWYSQTCNLYGLESFDLAQIRTLLRLGPVFELRSL